MEPAGTQGWWWYWGQTGAQVGQLLSENKAQLTDISPYIDVDGTLKFAVIMEPAGTQGWWWYWGQTGAQVGQLLSENKARLIALSPYLMYFFIRSKLDGNAIDIVGASTSAGTALDAYPPKPSGTDNQLWTFIPDPAGSGYYFMASKLDRYVIDIEAASTRSGAALDAWPQKPSGTENQLWEFIADPAGSGAFFISSKLNGNVIDVEGASTAAGARLDAYPRKFSGYDNQLWVVEDGAFPSVVETVAERAQGNSGYYNYVQANGSSCANLTGVKVTINFIEDLVWESSKPSTVPGFGIQLNASTKNDQPLDWLQFVVHIGDDQNLWPWINIWEPKGGSPQALWIQSVANPVATLPQAARIPAGYSITIALANDGQGRITSATWTVCDAAGSTIGNVNYALSTTEGGGVPPADLSTIGAFQVTFGGAMDGAYATFSSGEGVMVMEADQAMTVDWWPSCIGFTGGTAESANIGYAALGSRPDKLFSQPFGVVADSAQRREPNVGGRKLPPH